MEWEWIFLAMATIGTTILGYALEVRRSSRADQRSESITAEHSTQLTEHHGRLVRLETLTGLAQDSDDQESE